jgi:LuxR family transcriptional regulator, maltose regulon positive regulatory protein
MLLLRAERVLAGAASDDSNPPVKSNPTARRVSKRDTRIEICCLGQFSIRSPHSALTFLQANSQPLLLLQLLITGGPAGIERNEAEVKLWPRGSTELSDGALDTTLYRLRKLLGDPQAVTVDNKILRLNERRVTVDAWTFAAEADRLHAQLPITVNRAEFGAIALHCKKLFDLYQGHFFGQDFASPWVVRQRDVLQSKYLRCVKHVGQYWQSSRQWEHAIALYETALEIDNLAEEIHRELMRCHFARREFADVVRVFRRCRELLSIVLGVTPSDVTEMIYRKALAEQGQR